jgi:hypothetical protein
MNDFYGKPTAQSLPFNQAHRRFAITYTLAEHADEEERKAARKALTERFESALRTIFESAEYTQEQASLAPSALDVAALYQKDLDYEAALSSLRYGDGARQVRENVGRLFEAIKTRCDEIAKRYDFGIGCGWELKSRERFQSCVLRTLYRGIDVGWDQPLLDSIENAKLAVRGFKGRLYLPGEFQGGVHIQPPKMVSEKFYTPTLSRDHELGDSGIMKWPTSAVCFGPPIGQSELLVCTERELRTGAGVGLEKQGGALRADSPGV